MLSGESNRTVQRRFQVHEGAEFAGCGSIRVEIEP
jgi:hypothetical protein